MPVEADENAAFFGSEKRDSFPIIFFKKKNIFPHSGLDSLRKNGLFPQTIRLSEPSETTEHKRLQRTALWGIP
jgi:hypothetical protein